MSAGYSKTPLVDKLGIKPGKRLRLINAPSNYLELIGPLPEGATITSPASRGEIDFIHVFTTTAAELRKQLSKLTPRLAKDGMLWVSWPKGGSSIKTDLKEDRVREIGLDAGLVDVKVCAVDADWSGLKFVYRLKDRK